MSASTPPKGLNLQNNGSKKMEKKQSEEKKSSSYLCSRVPYSLWLLDARPARAGVRLVERLLLGFLEASLIDTTLVLPWTPVSPDEFIVTGDAGPRVGVRRASCCGILRTHTCSSAGSTSSSQCRASCCAP